MNLEQPALISISSPVSTSATDLDFRYGNRLQEWVDHAHALFGFQISKEDKLASLQAGRERGKCPFESFPRKLQHHIKRDRFSASVPLSQFFVNQITEVQVVGRVVRMKFGLTPVAIELPELDSAGAFYFVAEHLALELFKPWQSSVERLAKRRAEPKLFDVTKRRVFGGHQDSLRILAGLFEAVSEKGSSGTSKHLLPPTDFANASAALYRHARDLSELHEFLSKFIDAVGSAHLSPFVVGVVNEGPIQTLEVDLVPPFKRLIEDCADLRGQSVSNLSEVREIALLIFFSLSQEFAPSVQNRYRDRGRRQSLYDDGVFYLDKAIAMTQEESEKKKSKNAGLVTGLLDYQTSQIALTNDQWVAMNLVLQSWHIATELSVLDNNRANHRVITCPARTGNVLKPWYNIFQGIFSQWYGNEYRRLFGSLG